MLTTTRKNIGTEPGQYKETYVQALADALDATSDVANDTTPERLNTAYATLADAFSALQINGKNQVVNTKGSSVQPKGTGTDVTRTYLREVRNFSRSDNTGKRFGKPRSWTVENFQIDTGAEGVKQGIDNYPGYNCLQLGRWEESANRMNDADHENQRLYRRVTLPAGRYYFGAAYHYIDPSRVGSRAYLFVANEPLATAKVEERAIAYGTLNTADDDGNLYGLRFQLDQEQEVVLGWQMDGREQHTEFRCQQVQLMQYPIPDETDGIEEVGKREEEKYSFPEEGLGMGFQGAFDLSGRQVINRKLPKGIYISPTSRSCGALSKGHKIVVK